MQNHRRDTPGRHGTHPYVLGIGPIGGANNIGGAIPLTASGTTVYRCVPVMRRAVFARLGGVCLTVPVSAAGTLLCTARKYRAADNQVITLSKDLDLEALITREARYADWLAGLKDADLHFTIGDALEFHVVSTSAIGTQPTELFLGAELLMVE